MTRRKKQMLRIAFGIAAAPILIAAGQVTDSLKGMPYADWVGNLGALGVLGWVCWYILCRYLPAERKAAEDQHEKDRAAFAESLSQQRVQFAAVCDKMGERSERMQTEQLIRHDQWEHQRHEDSQAASESLRQLAETCARHLGPKPS